MTIRRPVPVVRLAFGALRRVVGAIRQAVEEAVEASSPTGPGGVAWTDEEIDQVADSIGVGVADMARDVLREVLGRRGLRHE